MDEVFKERMMQFYRSERSSHFIFILYNVFFVISCASLYGLFKRPLFLGIFYASVVISVLFIIMSLVRFFRTFSDYKVSLQAKDQQNLQFFKETELPKYEEKESKYSKARGIETVIIAIAFVGILVNHFYNKNELVQGAMSVILWQSSIIMAFDLFRQFRINEYSQQIRKLLGIPLLD